MLNQDDFDNLLAWLDTDPERAAKKYESIRRDLIRAFLSNHCYEAEDLADETINRVAKHALQLRASYEGEREPYFHAVAKYVRYEYYRRIKRVIQPPPEAPPAEELDVYLKCLEECLAKLTPKQANLIKVYYQEQKKAKIELHKAISKTLNVKAGALRGRVFRVREKLIPCVEDCVKKATGQ